MSGLALPPAEPPADDVDEALELLAAARRYLGDAENQWHILSEAVTEHQDETKALQPGTLRLYYAIERAASEQRVALWRSVVRELEHNARVLGLQP